MATNISGVFRQWLTGTGPAKEAYTRSYSTHQQSLIADKARARMYGQYTQVLYRVLDVELFSESRQVLSVLDRVPTIAGQYRQGMNAVVSSRPVLPPSLTISYEFNCQTLSLVTSASEPLAFPWSDISTAGEALQVVQHLPVSVISREDTGHVSQLTAARDVRPRPADVISKTKTSATITLVCQSSEIPYVPPSGEYVPQQVLMATQAATYPTSYRSTSTVRSQVVKVAQRRVPERLPRSKTRAVTMVSQAVSQRAPEGLPFGVQMSAQSFSQTVTSSEMAEPVGFEEVKYAASLTVSSASTPVPLGPVESRQARIKIALARSVSGPTISREDVVQMRVMALQQSEYDTPGAMLAAERAKSIIMSAVQSVEYPAAEIRSFSSYAQGRIAYTYRADDSAYPGPGDVYAGSKYATVERISALSVVARRESLPLSDTRVPQLQILSPVSRPVPSLEEIANTGSFNYQTIQHIVKISEYPNTNTPISHVQSSQISSHVAVTATYPPAVDQVDVAAYQLSSHIATVADYPDPETLAGPVSVDQSVNHAAVTAEYIDAGSLHAPVLMFSMSSNVATSAAYWDKDTPQSLVVVSAASQSAAFRAAYPNKDSAQSTATVDQVRQNIARKDPSLYEMPTPPRRHRVRIVCRVVY